MRVTSRFIVPYTTKLPEFDCLSYEENMDSMEMADSLSSEVFDHLESGVERACVILRTDDFTYAQIGFILGLKEPDVANTFIKIRKKLLSYGIKHPVTIENVNTNKV